MTATTFVSSIGRAVSHLPVLATALGGCLLAILLASLLHRHIRRRPWAQLASSPALAILIAPPQLVAELPTLTIASNVASWACVFAAFSLSVRAIFARARSPRARRTKRSPQATLLSIGSIALPAVASLLLWRAGEEPAMWVALVGCLGMLFIALWRPTPKQLKRAGIYLSLLLVCAVSAELIAATS